MNRMLRSSDFVNQHIEEGAVFENLDAIAFYRRTERETREGGDQISDGVIAFDLQSRTAVTLDGPNDQHQENEGPDGDS